MSRIISRAIADSIFILHAGVVVVALFGWLLPEMWPFYMAVLVGTLVSDLIFGHCIMSKWEFNLRKKLNPGVDYDYTYSSYYTYKITGSRLRNGFLRIAAYIFLISSLILSLWTHYGIAALQS